MRKNKCHDGFTMIEVMMVLLIFIIMLTFIVMNTNFSFNETTKLKNLASDLQAKIKLAKQEAILQHATIRLNINSDMIGFQRLQKLGKQEVWSNITDDSLLSNTKIEAEAVVKSDIPVILYPNGSFLPFNIQILSRVNSNYLTVYGDNNGSIGISQHATE